MVSASKSLLPRRATQQPRKFRRGRFIGPECEHRIPGSSAGVHDLGKFSRHYSRALLYRNDLIDRHMSQAVHLPAGPGGAHIIDLLLLSQTKVNPWVASRHVAHSALGLFRMDLAFGG